MNADDITILRGEAAYLTAAQGEKLATIETGQEIYRLRTAELRLAVWDQPTRTLSVIEGPALVQLITIGAFAQERAQRSIDKEEQFGRQVAAH